MIKSLCISLLILLMAGCYYSSDEVYFVDVEISKKPKLEVVTSMDTMTSVTITDSLLFSYSAIVDTGGVVSTRIFFHNYLIYLSDTVRNEFWINPDFIEDNGHYDMSMEIYYRTTTGSLADRTYAEFYLWDTSWVVNVLSMEDLK